ncbi:MAG TPA: glutamyl-tRNA reductase [Acidothermaceae bacterium]|nr:glutamyl-tRNA reductase [Acidothermaceae bacterium]
MSLLVVGLSHRSAPLPLLERTSLSVDAAGKLLDDVVAAPAIDEAMLLSTCNRVELYASVEKFHAGVAALSDLLARHTGVGFDELSPHVYVHYEDRAAQHLFAVTSSLDSMLVGEHQILGQVRAAFRTARDRGDAGSALHDVIERALHAAKRVHAETGIDAVGTTLIEAGLRLGAPGGLKGQHAVVVGAGSMASIAVAALRTAGVSDLVVASRTMLSAELLATRAGGRAAAMADLEKEIASADVVITCTGSDSQVLAADVVKRAIAVRAADRPLFILDVAVPRDVDPRVGEVAGVSLFDIDALAPLVDNVAAADDVLDARRIVDMELAAYVSARRASGVAPTVVALRDKGAQMVAAELHRLERRLPNLDDSARAEIAATMQRVVDKVLHAPTVRVQELADTVGPTSYPEALRRLFDLDPSAPAALVAPDLADDETGPGEQR